ncbi:MAG: Gfo/Idh/MocA family oxidoreductase [Prevotellaceae bacterium]|nr:Gfo/Idh/MocA family oxidoreductase [Prevotellaceae bacterium]
MKRRNFLKVSALGATAVAMPISPIYAASAATVPAVSKSANGKVNLGFIGLGQQAMYLLGTFLEFDDVRVLAGCDVYDIKRDRFVRRVKDYYHSSKGEKKVQVDVYEDYQDLLARKDIDAVVIATPDHQHAIIAIAACKAGKDVYLEKPLTLTIYEGQQLVKAVRKYGRILQVGSQQRSSGEFIHAATLCREGLLGKIEKIKVHCGRNATNPVSAAPVPYNLPKTDVPAGLNWDKWLGPLPASVWYHPDLDPIIDEEHNEQLWASWRWYKETGGGLMTDWGAHMFDIAQWAIGKDGNGGPVKVSPAGYGRYEQLTFEYDNGIIVTEEPYNGGEQGLQIYGENGWLKVCRGSLRASDRKFEKMDLGIEAGAYESQSAHRRIWIDAVKAHVDPNCPVETGHTSCTVCNLGNIAIQLGRPVRWNPIVQKFMDDPEATKLLHYAYREGYTLDV